MIECRFENGNQAKLRHVAVDSIAVLDGKVLLVKRSEKLAEGGKWALPGGYLNRDETLEQGALRELHEETGWEATIREMFIISASPNRGSDPYNWQNVNFTFLADLKGKNADADWESSEVRFFPITDLPPENEIAFDHGAFLKLYLEHLHTTKQLPIIR